MVIMSTIFDVTFDMDGVLADTHVAVARAYAHAGVTMPEEAWGRPAAEWLTDPSVAKKKAQWYPHMLAVHGKKLPPRKTLKRLRCEGYRVAVVTNASFNAASAVLTWLDLDVDGLLCARKELDLALLQPAVHVDDQLINWLGCRIGYAGQSAKELYLQIVGRI